MNKGLHEFTIKHTGDLDAYFTEMMKDSIFRQAYAAEKKKMASTLTLLETREESRRSEDNEYQDREREKYHDRNVDKTC